MDGALIVQPINHKFDHSLVTRSVDIRFLAKCSVFVLFVSKLKHDHHILLQHNMHTYEKLRLKFKTEPPAIEMFCS